MVQGERLGYPQIAHRGHRMAITAWLAKGETLGDRLMRVDHCGEHGAVSIYTAQRMVARWRAPDMVAEIDGFIAHEERHRALFAAELARRGRRRCCGYGLCGAAGTLLGLLTGLVGRRAIAATTVGIERVVLRHLDAQLAALGPADPAASAVINDVVAEERAHHDESMRHLRGRAAERMVVAVTSAVTEAIIWTGMRSPA